MIRSMLMIGSARAVMILISLLRLKLLAAMTGPAGIGLLGVYNSLQSTSQTLAGLGLGNSGVREIAGAKDDPAVLSRVRIVLFTANLIQGVIAMAFVWLLRDTIAFQLFGSNEQALQVGLVGVAVLLSLISASQTTLLVGLRRIADMARVTVLSALAGTIAGLVVVWLRGDQGIIWFLIAQPATSVLVAWWFTRRLPDLERQAWRPGLVWRTWKPMASLGIVFMLSGFASTMTLLLVRGIISRDLGLEAAGLFAASWAIAMTYIGFLFGAMSADYFPRLVEVISDRPTANKLMNDQIQLGLAIGGPVLLVLIGMAPWAMRFLYSEAFEPAASMLQWQAFGNVFQLASWPLSYALVAAARSRLYFFIEVSWNLVFVSVVWLGLRRFGLEVAGTGFAGAFMAYFIVLCLIVRHDDFRFSQLSILLLGTHVTLAVGMLVIAHTSPVTAAGTGVALAIATGVIGLRVVLMKVGPNGKVATKLRDVFTRLRWPVS